MSEPGFQPFTVATARQESLWSRAPGWRNLIVFGSFLTLAAVATPLLLPQPVDQSVSPQVAPSHIAVVPSTPMPATPKVALAQPAIPVQRDLSAHPATIPVISRPHRIAPKPDTASLRAQPESEVRAGAPLQRPSGESNAPVPDLASLPVGTDIVTSGELDRVGRHNRYNPSLGGDLPISITIVSPPLHGTVSTQDGTAMLSFPNAGVTRVSNVKNVFYLSNSNYVGQDSFTYTRTSTDPNDPLNGKIITVSIYVKPSANAQQAASPQTAQN